MSDFLSRVWCLASWSLSSCPACVCLVGDSICRQAIMLAGFRCEACNASLERLQRVCLLCPQGREGALKRSGDGRWVHAACSLYTPGVVFG